MRRVLLLVLTALCIASQPLASQSRGLKVHISVDMEGLAGVVNARDVQSTGPDYPHFRTIMAGETNAAIEGAFRGGATEVVVRDSHGAKNNLLPADVDPRARLLRGASTGPRNMMEGIDSTFAAVVFVGYHAKAGTPGAIADPDVVVFEDAQRVDLGGLNLGSVRELSGRRIVVGGFTWGLLPFGPGYAFANYETTRGILRVPEDQTSFVLVGLAPGADPVAVQRELRGRLLPHAREVRLP